MPTNLTTNLSKISQHKKCTNNLPLWLFLAKLTLLTKRTYYKIKDKIQLRGLIELRVLPLFDKIQPKLKIILIEKPFRRCCRRKCCNTWYNTFLQIIFQGHWSVQNALPESSTSLTPPEYNILPEMVDIAKVWPFSFLLNFLVPSSSEECETKPPSFRKSIPATTDQLPKSHQTKG